MERTHDLLIRLARRVAQRHGRISNELNIFLLQVQMRGNSFTPMGVFKISRPLVATVNHIPYTYHNYHHFHISLKTSNAGHRHTPRFTKQTSPEPFATLIRYLLHVVQLLLPFNKQIQKIKVICTEMLLVVWWFSGGGGDLVV